MKGSYNHLMNLTRRHFLKASPLALGGIALAQWLNQSHGAESAAAEKTSAAAPTSPLAPRSPHYAPRAKSVIFLHMAGSPPHLDLFDYKPELVKRTGENCPDQFLKGRRFAFTSGVPKLLGTPQSFRQYGESGAWVSAACPKIAELVDDLCFIKSMHTEQFNHAPAELTLYTGSPQFGRPSLGSWVTYGLGSENQNLPGFVALVSSGTNPSGGSADWASGFLPSVFQGVQCRTDGEPVLYISNPQGMSRDLRQKSLSALRDLNELQAAELGSPETRTRIEQYELAFRMQATAPEVMDISRESKATLEAYGAKPGQSSLANNCLLARRLVEQGVRFVQLHDWGWDFHGTNPSEDIREGLVNKCRTMDVPVAALLRDLKSRGLLDETLVVWGGEFGRTPFREGRTAGGKVMGRDHHPHCFTMFLAGGGIKPGFTYGASDDFGFDVAENKVPIWDLQATLLHLLGLDHLRLTYPYSGRDFRLTDVFGEIVKPILA